MTERCGNDDNDSYDEKFIEQQYEQTYTDTDFLEAIRECSVASTGKVADEIGCNRTTALRRLDTLEEQGTVAVDGEVGRTRVWAVVDE
ncbi:hypothetical protein SAMN04515672_0186 [Natronorubrum texcoconense]|uniref:Uncharacterized protein n=1 Tax=Natronorubrum texcoconense TaxID=1095776 RepID=A0A1G9HBP2_9EURY|nr:hypothetical protein SAMN04515672_0186 [Natronorubrum texcoconense]